MIAEILSRWRGVARRGLFLAMAGVISTGLTPVHSHANVKYAGIVIDAKTGRTLYADQADAPRFPASLTKMMTLYLTRCAGKNQLRFHEHAPRSDGGFVC